MASLPEADERLVRSIYAEHGTALMGYASRLTGGDRHRAEDIVQETILRAWQHPEAFEPQRQRTVRAWLFTVARNLAIDSVRSRAARPREIAEPAGWQPVAVDSALDRALVGLELSDALDSLSPQHRDVIVALYFRDLSLAEAGEELGVPVGTVKSRCYYALRALRVLCQERELLP